jgi:hypothetical protein
LFPCSPFIFIGVNVEIAIIRDDPAAPLRLDATVIPGYTGGLRRGIADSPPARVPP